LPSLQSGHIIVTMKTKRKSIPAGKFKAECLALLDRVEETREALVVTKRGRAVAQVVPMEEEEPVSLIGSVQFLADIVEPIADAWDADQ